MSEFKTDATGDRIRFQPELYTDNDSIILRQLTISDAKPYFNLVDEDREHLSQFGDETASKYPDLSAVEGSIVYPKGEQYRFGIWEENEMVGFIKIKKNDEGDFETGSWIGKRFTGNDYANRARNVLLDYTFQNTSVSRVVSKIVVGNEASRKSVEKTGYRFVAEEDGEWVYAIEREDYLKIRKDRI